MLEKELSSVPLIPSLINKMSAITMDASRGHSTATLSAGLGISGQQTFLNLILRKNV